MRRLRQRRAAATPPCERHVDAWIAATRRRVARAITSAQKLLQLTLPGIPDVYQGTELVDLSLVDPDNRRPVDFTRPRRAAARVSTAVRPDDLDDEKLLVTSRALRLRRDRPGVVRRRPHDGLPLRTDERPRLRRRARRRRGDRVVAVVTTPRGRSARTPGASATPPSRCRRHLDRRADRPRGGRATETVTPGPQYLLTRCRCALLTQSAGRDERDLAVWAPSAKPRRRRHASTVAVGGRSTTDRRWTRRRRGEGWWWTASTDRHGPARLRVPARRRARPARPAQPLAARGVHGPSRTFDAATLSSGPTPAGAGRAAARASRAACSTSCTSGRSPPAGTFDAATEPARPPRRARRRRRGAHAGRRLPGPVGLGVRRGRPVCGARRLRRSGRAPAIRRRLPRNGGSASASTSSTTTSAPAATTCRSSARTSPTAHVTPWGPAVNLDGAGVRRGAPVRPRQRAALVPRLPRRRAAPGRGARAAGRRAPHLLAELADEVATLSRELGRPLTSSPRATSTTPSSSPPRSRAAGG